MMADFILMNRPMQWFVIGLGHALILSFMLQTSPQATPAVREVIQARLITSQPPQAITPNLSQPLPPQKEQAKPKAVRLQPKSAAILAAAQRVETAPPTLTKPASETPPSAPHASAPAAAASPTAFVPPIFNAAYLENPPPSYPPASRRFGETGHVLLRVFVSATGRAEQIELKTSSGFDRLDDAARAAVTRWRFVPARRGDEPVAAWVLVPITFAM